MLYRLKNGEEKYKLCRVKQLEMGPKKVPYVVRHDGRTIRYPDPAKDKVINATIVATGGGKGWMRWPQGACQGDPEGVP